MRDGTNLAGSAAPMLVACSPRRSRALPTEHDLRVDWAIVHAGNDAASLARTLDACGAIAPPARTFVVTHPSTQPHDLEGRADHVFCQPASRGTGLGVFVALAMIRRWQPAALVTIAASHAAGSTAAAELRALRAVAARHPERVATFEHVACGTVDALWEAGRRGEPNLLDILDSLVPLVGTRDEDEAIDYIYQAYLPVRLTELLGGTTLAPPPPS